MNSTPSPASIEQAIQSLGALLATVQKGVAQGVDVDLTGLADRDIIALITHGTKTTKPGEKDMRGYAYDQGARTLTVQFHSGAVWRYIVVSAMLVVAIGTWLVWLSAFIQHNLQEEGVREACQRAMPVFWVRCSSGATASRSS